MSRPVVLTLLYLLYSLCISAARAQILVRTPVTEFEKQKLDAFVAGRRLLDIRDFTAPQLDSIAPLENLIFRKAVLLGGLEATFVDVVVPNSARSREAIREGMVVGGGTAQWHDYYAANSAEVFESDALLPPGSYKKGLYATSDKVEKLAVARLDDLRTLRAVSSDTWVVDWRTLRGLPFKTLYSAPNRPTQFRMVQGGRADVTLQDFSSMPDQSIEEQGLRLYPVRGVKIALDGTRHFFVSKKHPDGARVFEALQKGMRIMRQNGEIERMLANIVGAGEATRGWIVLNAR